MSRCDGEITPKQLAGLDQLEMAFRETMGKLDDSELQQMGMALAELHDVTGRIADELGDVPVHVTLDVLAYFAAGYAVACELRRRHEERSASDG